MVRDFDPVRAKAEGRDHGLPTAIADLFPDRFENSELGEIPAGWQVILSRANGSTFLEISKSVFRPIPISSPRDELFAAFDVLVRPLYARIVMNERGTRDLAALRDTLLPKLVSGEMRVRDAERIVTAAV